MSLLSLFDYNIDNKLISVVGAGGKTSFLEAFLEEYENTFGNKKKLLFTSTTKMYNNYHDAIIESSVSNIAKYKELHNHKNTFLIFKQINNASNKLIGFSNGEIDEIYLSKTFDTIISESDGANSKQVKAHAHHEPNNPSLSTDIVAIVSLDAIGKKVDSEVHRANIFYNITGCNDIITKESIASLFNCNDNYFTNSNNTTKRHIIFNKADLIKEKELKELSQYFRANIKRFDTISFISIIANTRKIKNINTLTTEISK